MHVLGAILPALGVTDTAMPATVTAAFEQTAAADGGSGLLLPLTAGLTIFILASFVGFEIIAKIPPTLHTPLMSGSNAISGITLVGAILSAGAGYSWLTTTLGFLAVVTAMVNVVGGFLVTNRMLEMFRGRKKRRAKAGG
jgi:NAD(P) transhydrogenase subunit alpha